MGQFPEGIVTQPVYCTAIGTLVYRHIE